MKLATCGGLVALLLTVWGSAPDAQFRGLDVGTVTATVDGAPFSATVSVASIADGELVLTNLRNEVQLQVPKAKVGKDLATERPVKVTGGRFQVKLIPPSR